MLVIDVPSLLGWSSGAGHEIGALLDVQVGHGVRLQVRPLAISSVGLGVAGCIKVLQFGLKLHDLLLLGEHNSVTTCSQTKNYENLASNVV